MQMMSAKAAKSSVGMLLAPNREGPVEVEKHGSPVFVVASVEEFQPMSLASAAPIGTTRG